MSIKPLMPLLRLPLPQAGQRRAEGGLRLANPGQLKASSPGRPLITYVTVVRNASRTLPRTLQSVREQHWPAVEHIVIDGLSDDGTLAVIEAHAGQIDYFVSEPDQGLYEALNKAMSLARGSLICVLNADDWLAPDAAAIAAAALQRFETDPSQPGPHLLLTSAWLHNGTRRRLWLPGPLSAGSWLSCPNICHNGVYATPAAWAAAGPYDTRLKVVADSRWLLSALDAGVRIHQHPAPTVHYVTGGISGDVKRHVLDCVRLVAQRFPQLGEAEVWTLIHAFYPWTGNLAHFAQHRPAHLGDALNVIVAQHGDNRALLASLAAAGLARQCGQAQRVKSRKAPSVQLRRGLARAWYGLRDLAQC